MRLRAVILLAFAAHLAAQPKAAGNHGMDPERLARIPARLKVFVEKGEIAGAVTLVARRGTIAAFDAVGYQDALSRKPMAKDSIFQIMSMTKPMVGTAIMMLAEEGRLALTDPVEKHLPEFRGQMRIAAREHDGAVRLRKPSRPITIRDLMTHTSGLTGPPPGLDGLYQKMDRTLAEAVAIYSQTPLEFDPGTEWRYSNPGIATLGRIIEVVSDQPFEKFMAERLWGPLGMKDTFIFPPEDRKPRIAAVHASQDGKLTHAGPGVLGGLWSDYRKGARYSAPEFGAYSTAMDLLAFYEMLRKGGVHGGKRMLSRAAVETMTALHTGDIRSGHMPGTGFGLTWEVVRENLGTLNFLSKGTFGHGGAFGTHGWIDKEKELVGVYLVQGGAGAADGKYAFMRMASAAVID